MSLARKQPRLERGGHTQNLEVRLVHGHGSAEELHPECRPTCPFAGLRVRERLTQEFVGIRLRPFVQVFLSECPALVVARNV